MIAIDTNLLVRLLTNDDPQQAERVIKLFKIGTEIFISKTVLLETSWVLRSLYEFERLAVVAALRRVGGMPNIVFEDEQSVALAFCWVMDNGLEFADALHLATARIVGAQPFYSFDLSLVKKAANFAAVEP